MVKSEFIQTLQQEYWDLMDDRFYDVRQNKIGETLKVYGAKPYNEEIILGRLERLTNYHNYYGPPRFINLIATLKEDFSYFPFTKFANESYSDFMKQTNKTKYGLIYSMLTELKPKLESDFVQNCYKDHIEQTTSYGAYFIEILKEMIQFSNTPIEENILKEGLSTILKRNASCDLIQNYLSLRDFKEDKNYLTKWNYLPFD